MWKVTRSSQFHRHLRATLVLTLATLVSAMSAKSYLGYLAKDGDIEVTSAESFRVWAIVAIFALATLSWAVVTAMLGRGKMLGHIRFVPAAILTVGLVLHFAVSKLLS